MITVIQLLHPGDVYAHNTALQPTANPLRGLSAAELGRYAAGQPTGNPSC